MTYDSWKLTAPDDRDEEEIDNSDEEYERKRDDEGAEGEEE